jgi:hypothetical protein
LNEKQPPLIFNLSSCSNLLKFLTQYFLIDLCKEANKRDDIKIRFHLVGEIHLKDYYANFIESVYHNNLKNQFRIHREIMVVSLRK